MSACLSEVFASKAMLAQLSAAAAGPLALLMPAHAATEFSVAKVR
jgi:hypothetical protein